ncbi:UPF0160 protein MYG1, mitochondrial [Eumeta japonica]|uniref:UPF0160 protein MYG1, mitochondrial n=1 Tax=Eumeta variegata TaxID=151549 RepID=A0A4C1SRC3_EUMVA|nr:UPF0160 protein MYG1, mitochondrial [Eumeta japonica]
MKVGTHDGVFHCDEVLACYMLKQLPEYKNAEIIRTRETEKLKECDIVVDVGAEFDHENRRYDHHQREFKETLSSLRPELGDKYKIKLSSAGLVYAYYGEEVIKQLVPANCELKTENLKLIYRKVYENFIEEIDAIDNGVPMTDEEPKYKIRTHISARVGRLNPEWNSKQEQNIDEIFQKAMKLVSEEFLYTLHYFVNIWLPARDFVRSALESRFETHKSGEIVEFKERFPWKEHLFDLETELGMQNEIKYVIFNDKPNSWRVQAVPVNPTSFVTRQHSDSKSEELVIFSSYPRINLILISSYDVNRCSDRACALTRTDDSRAVAMSDLLSKRMVGRRDELLSDVAGISDCIFCHATGFIGGNRNRDGYGNGSARGTRLGVARRDRTPAHKDIHVSRECEQPPATMPSRSRSMPTGANAGHPACVCAAEHARCAPRYALRPGPACIFCDYPQFIEIPEIHPTAPKLLSPHFNSLKCRRLGTAANKDMYSTGTATPALTEASRCPTPRAYHAADGGALARTS